MSIIVEHGFDISGLLKDRPKAPVVGTRYFPTDVGDQFVYNGAFWQPQRSLSRRTSRLWIAGERGKPSLNADIQNAAESTRMIADPDFEVLGTNMTSALSTFNAEGGINLTTAGADNDQAILLPHLDANQSSWTSWTWGSDKASYWMLRFKTGASIAAAIIWAGLKLTNTPTTATDNDQAFFRYQNGVNSGRFQAIYSIDGTDSANDSGVTVAAATEYVLEVAIDASRIARFFINNTLVLTSTALKDATDFIPYLGVQASGAAGAKAVTVYGQYISRTSG